MLFCTIYWKYRLKGNIFLLKTLMPVEGSPSVPICWLVHHPSLQIKQCFKGTVNIISSDPPCKHGNDWFTTVPCIWSRLNYRYQCLCFFKLFYWRVLCESDLLLIKYQRRNYGPSAWFTIVLFSINVFSFFSMKFYN